MSPIFLTQGRTKASPYRTVNLREVHRANIKHIGCLQACLLQDTLSRAPLVAVSSAICKASRANVKSNAAIRGSVATTASVRSIAGLNGKLRPKEAIGYPGCDPSNCDRALQNGSFGLAKNQPSIKQRRRVFNAQAMNEARLHHFEKHFARPSSNTVILFLPDIAPGEWTV